jgi:hypothetical protein
MPSCLKPAEAEKQIIWSCRQPRGSKLAASVRLFGGERVLWRCYNLSMRDRPSEIDLGVTTSAKLYNTISLLFFHFFADQRDVPGFRIDPGAYCETTAGHGIGVFLFADYAVLDRFCRGRRCLTANWLRCCRYRLLLRGTARQNQAKAQARCGPHLLHALCFRSRRCACRCQSWLLAPGQ